MKRVVSEAVDEMMRMLTAWKKTLEGLQRHWHQSQMPLRGKVLAAQVCGIVWWLQTLQRRGSTLALKQASLGEPPIQHDQEKVLARLLKWKQQLARLSDALMKDCMRHENTLLRLVDQVTGSGGLSEPSNNQLVLACDELVLNLEQEMVQASLWRAKVLKLQLFVQTHAFARIDQVLAALQPSRNAVEGPRDMDQALNEEPLPVWKPYCRVNHRRCGVEVLVDLRGVRRSHVEVSWKSQSKCSSPSSSSLTVERQDALRSGALQISGIKWPTQQDGQLPSLEDTPSFGKFSIELPIDNGNGHQAKQQWLANGTLMVYVPYDREAIMKRRLRSDVHARHSANIQPANKVKASSVQGSPLSSVPEDSEIEDDSTTILFPSRPARALSFKDKLVDVWTSYFNGRP